MSTPLESIDFNYSYEARVEVWRKIMEYNSINDLAYDNGKIEYSNFGGAIHFWNENWDESIVDSVYFRTGGRDGYWHAGFGTIVIDDIARDKFDYISVAPAYDPVSWSLTTRFSQKCKKYSMSLLYRKVMLLPSLMQLYRLEAKSLSMQRGHCRTVLFEKGSPFLGGRKEPANGAVREHLQRCGAEPGTSA
ncbi:hypothetical protein P4114_22880 [Pseudomonas aeruginosa]|nr:hypothetical protein [Pseudomonas aeruginosa]